MTRAAANGHLRRVEAVLLDPATSDWLRGALVHMMTRDPVDALNDAEMLVSIARSRLDDTVGNKPQETP